MSQNQTRIIPLYASNGDVEAFLAYPYLYNRGGEWIGFVTPKRDVYSVMGNFVGTLSDDARIVRKRAMDEPKPKLQPPPAPARLTMPPSVPLAPMMSDLPLGLIDVLQDEPELLHTRDSGELREDMD